MEGVIIKLPRLADFHDVAQVHHRYAVGDVADDGKVMGDEEVAQVLVPVLELFQEIDDLRLDGNVQRGDGLVAHDERRVAGQGAGYPDALALAAGKLVREAAGHRGIEADDAEELFHPVLIFAPGQYHAVDFQRLTDDAAGALPGVKGGIGVLKDEGDIFTDGPQFLFREGGDISALEHNFTAGGTIEAEDAAADGSLAAAAFADKPQRLIPHELEGNAIDGFNIGDFTPKQAPHYGEIHL